ncbi:hypothetical protein [Sphingomonas sp. 28-63-12]|uniref:T4 family baseplate hub assembly chaperone n=1 Tax=Sphingomonas sp. 28-63-12 TaxID=1970434 RepID=UPI000BD99758|nr:MAG: hypothetical protein B7Y47_14415 [Sphingomonas sp. 28-63-12]
MPGASESDLAAMPLGARDALLLDLRERLFGHELAIVATCPRCAEQLEAGFSLDDVRVARPPESSAWGDAADTSAAIGGYRVTVRAPATADLLAIPAGADAATAHAILLDRCIEAQDPAGRPIAGHALPPIITQPIVDDIARANPQAVVELDLCCTGCAHRFGAVFDIAVFLLREIHRWARQLLSNIDSLASAYGWREADILALSPRRRQIYAEMVAP